MVFERFPSVKIERPAKFGGTVEFRSYSELEAAYAAGTLHPMYLKKTTTKYLDDLIQPVRRHFKKDLHAKKSRKRSRATS